MPDTNDPSRTRHGKWRVLLGLTLLAVVAAGVAWPVTWQQRQDRARTQALHAYAPLPARPGHPSQPGCRAGTGHLLSIERTGLLAPVREGASDAVLAVAVGHEPSTPQPGQFGVAVLLAHDVGYFSRLSDVQVGDTVRLGSGCTTQVFTVTARTVTKPGAAIPLPSGGRGLSLVTCWPTNALWWTNQRFIVDTTLTAVIHDGVTHTIAPALPQYRVPIPASLAHASDPTAFSVGLSTLTVTGTPDPTFAQSPAPLNAEHAALAVLFAARTTVDAQRADWWAAITQPGLAMPARLPSLRSVRVMVRVSGARVDRVVLLDGSSSVTVTLTGSTARLAAFAGPR